MRKLEQSLRALSLEYYHLQAKRVKKHKKHINKSAQLALHVRHSFKVRLAPLKHIECIDDV